MRVRNCLEAVQSADRLVEVLRLADELAVEASRDGGIRNVLILLSAIESSDQISAIAAIHALANIADEESDEALADLLSSERGFVREHAAWALHARAPRPGPIGRLIGLVIAGGFVGMLAQRTLERWARSSPELVAIGLESALLSLTHAPSRYRLAETLGLVHHSIATAPLLRIASDTGEEIAVRMAAVAALGERAGSEEVQRRLTQLAEAEAPLGEVARLALTDLANHDEARSGSSTPLPEAGLTVAQLFLHADIDPELRHAGSGDTGGIATLLVRLGDALVSSSERGVRSSSTDSSRQLPIKRVITLSRGGVDDAVQSLSAIEDERSGHQYGRIPLLQEPMQATNAWPLRVAARRGIARILKAAGPVDLIHLRMADVGSLAAFDVARELDIPVIFTAAPDPHGLINSLDMSGKLHRQNFGTIDEAEHFWFRARLVQRLAANSAHNVFFPRPNLQHDMQDLMGIDMGSEPGRHTTVPEGIDLAVIDQAVREAEACADGGPPSAPLAELCALLEELPRERRSLPVLISVGRFHRVKGMASIVAAWAGSDLSLRANLLLVGGNLENPSADEREQLTRIDQTVDPENRMAAGLVLSGHRPNTTVSRWIAATRIGLPGFIAPGGVYVCGSLKEEFGLALLEAMASGLLLVAPDGGGPATYVEQRRTGFLTTTWDLELLRGAMQDALDCAAEETTAERAAYSRGVVQERFTVEAMAEALTRVYSDVHRDDVAQRRELVRTA
ncbi:MULTISPECIES: glycosyltransferase [unclassified Leucobacter]|uniref:glycosyltransferase n=1 Tax=unclassified Leucobacter TaxID=2621730 RepID=UPI00165E10C7|nr:MULTISPECIES: glycosyltransferase [unclassified Leucobacter]MBC9936000.1 glycosyltransferase [Leucobacter sp. cx-87]